jgi:hypothetical protein
MRERGLAGVKVVAAGSLVLLASLYAPSASSLAPTAGVHPDHHALYAGPEFACKDGSAKVAIDQVNDNFCDCADGRCVSAPATRLPVYLPGCWDLVVAACVPLLLVACEQGSRVIIRVLSPPLTLERLLDVDRILCTRSFSFIRESL